MSRRAAEAAEAAVEREAQPDSPLPLPRLPIARRAQALLLLDADFLPSRGLSEELAAPESYATLLRALAHKQAIVLPAFETADDGEAGRGVALEAVQGEHACSHPGAGCLPAWLPGCMNDAQHVFVICCRKDTSVVFSGGLPRRAPGR